MVRVADDLVNVVVEIFDDVVVAGFAGSLRLLQKLDESGSSVLEDWPFSQSRFDQIMKGIYP